MIALGFCNLAGSFVQSFPTTGSFSRTAVNSASGVKTQAGGIYTGALVLLALAFLMPLCAYIPQASLGALIITAVIYSVEFDLLVPMWKSKRKWVLHLWCINRSRSRFSSKHGKRKLFDLQDFFINRGWPYSIFRDIYLLLMLETGIWNNRWSSNSVFLHLVFLCKTKYSYRDV